MVTWSNVYVTSVDAFLYGFFGAFAAALWGWLVGRPIWHRLMARLDARTAATNRHAAAVEVQNEHLQTIAARLAPIGGT